MPQYTSLPDSDPDQDTQPLPRTTDSTSFHTYGLKIAKWVYIFDLLRVGIMIALLGLNVDATIITKDRAEVEDREAVWGSLALVLVKKVGGLSGMQKVELGVTIFYVSGCKELLWH
jgi:hypothetical protein